MEIVTWETLSGVEVVLISVSSPLLLALYSRR